MSTGGTGGNLHGLNAGASAVEQSILDSNERERRASTGETSSSGGGGQSVLNKLRSALTPGDAKRQTTTPHDEAPARRESHRDASEHNTRGGILEHVMPGHQEHTNQERGGGLLNALKPSSFSSSSSSSSGRRRSSLLDALNPGDSAGNVALADEGGPARRRRSSAEGSAGGRRGYYYQYDTDPSKPHYDGPPDYGESRSLGDTGRRAVPRTSAFDREGAVGKQFTTEGGIGGTANKIGGPFSQEGVVGRQFVDTGSVGGQVQNTLGRDDSTRKGP
ncbi:hypothetical protein F4780DRAFT_775272 [Xylariomycetidae sp. FL0641]|nr:hypothetical protein F4780DRAFT_775272 [Xylariomycetidae sp. FL0641]